MEPIEATMALHKTTTKLSNRAAWEVVNLKCTNKLCQGKFGLGSDTTNCPRCGAPVVRLDRKPEIEKQTTLPRRTAQTHFGPITLDARQQAEFRAWYDNGAKLGENILQALLTLPNGAQIQQAAAQTNITGAPHDNRNQVKELVGATPEGRAFVGSFVHHNEAAERLSKQPALERNRTMRCVSDYTAYHLLASNNVGFDDLLQLSNNDNIKDRTLALMLKHPRVSDYLRGRIQDHPNKGKLSDQAMAEVQPALIQKPWLFKTPKQQEPVLRSLTDVEQLKQAVTELAKVEKPLLAALDNPQAEEVEPVLAKSEFASVRTRVAEQTKKLDLLQKLITDKDPLFAVVSF